MCRFSLQMCTLMQMHVFNQRAKDMKAAAKQEYAGRRLRLDKVIRKIDGWLEAKLARWKQRLAKVSPSRVECSRSSDLSLVMPG